MDLCSQFPRSVRERLGGYVHLARMLDKSRASLSGTLGEYVYPCPLDKLFLEFIGISDQRFLEVVKERIDQEVEDWIKQNAVPHSQPEIESWNDMMLTRGPDSKEKWEYFQKIRDSIDPARTDITTWADLLDLEEYRPIPNSEAMTN